MSWAAVAIGGGSMLLKSELIDAPKAERQRKLAAETQRYSPWTGLKANPVQEADPFGSTLQGAAAGASAGSQMKLQNAQADWLNKNPYNSSTGANAAMGNPWQSSNINYNTPPGGNIFGVRTDPGNF